MLTVVVVVGIAARGLVGGRLRPEVLVDLAVTLFHACTLSTHFQLRNS